MLFRSLVKSSNLGTVLTAQRITSATLESYLHAFGFGDKTAIDFPDESSGILMPVEKWRGTEKITVAYGYGFASTSLQLVSAVNVVAAWERIESARYCTMSKHLPPRRKLTIRSGASRKSTNAL